ncbi:hypothetical protein B0J12DRAFT_789176 [Macrophomina phaseolina]|uniref:Rhodopsin domain-containing protein n=1 Tax=Macrophomina phaseolina TaxID=35725 RepID=A0ABQ8FXQ0_9PEZI|nr:hypothetical protein B0J12DRAFT_789176 [Macrophomina phaseolina]
MSFTLSATNILTDWTCALLPIPLLWSLEMNRNSKIAAGVLLSFGVFASVCALVRLQYTIGLTATEDYFYHISFVLLWAFAEVGVGMTAANCSTLRPIFSKLFELSSSLSAGRGSGGGQRDGSATGWFFGPSHARHDGAIELDDADLNPQRKGGCRVETTVTVDSRGHSATRAAEESSLEDDESARQILRPSARGVRERVG